MTDIKEISFEDLKNQNGMTFWWASELQHILNYSSFTSFEKVIQKAQKTIMSLNIKMHENIETCINIKEDGSSMPDYKLSRFSCYLIAMNADSKKSEVAKAQAYFAAITGAFEEMLEKSDDFERLVIRDELKDSNSSLARAAKSSGVKDYAKFANAGYLGMYNMYNWQLAKKRGIDKKKIFEHMGRTELAANLFRTTMTEEKIRSTNLKGQKNLEHIHKSVGQQVRKIVIDNTGKSPESLKVEKRLPEVKKELKKGYKKIKDQDK